MEPAPADDFRPAAWLADLRRAGQLLTRVPLPGDHAPAVAGTIARALRVYPQAVTRQMMANFAAGGAAVNQLCTSVDADLRVYELDLDHPTADFTVGPAMSEEGCARAMAYGMMAVEPGVDLLALGEMGIGNTTAAAALALKVAALAALAPWAACAALVAAGAASRAGFGLVVTALPPARADGLGAGLGRPSRATVLIALGFGMALAAAAVGPVPAAIALGAAAIVGAALAWLARRQVGGYTGDVLGATQQTTETVMLLALSADPSAIGRWIAQS